MELLDGLFGPQTETGGALLRLLVAAILGGAVGFERETSHKPAGFRTHLLISVGSALLTELSIELAASTSLAGGFQADPGRIAAQIVTGVGFLGAGTILRGRGNIIGLTTAASIWVVAAIGMAVGAGFPVLALGGTALVILALRILRRFEKRVAGSASGEQRLEIELSEDPALIEAIERDVRRIGMEVELIEVHKSDTHYVASFRLGEQSDREAALRILIAHTGVHRITLR